MEQLVESGWSLRARLILAEPFGGDFASHESLRTVSFLAQHQLKM